MNAFLSLFKPKPLIIPQDLAKRPELSAADYESKREMFPLYPLSGWTPRRILDMLEQHDLGNFQASELFYHALRKEGLISSALDTRRAAVQIFPHKLQCPKDAPDEMHLFTERLAADWQSVMPDDVRGDIIERTNVFGFMVCRSQWAYKQGQRQPRLIPWTHSSLSYRQDLYCYQGLSEKGIEYISNDGREWVVFSLGGTRPWLRGLIRPLAFVYFGIITGDDRWLNFNDTFAEPMKVRYMPRLPRETAEAQRLRDKDDALRGGDVVLCPREAKDTGYDFRYEQVDAQGYKTLADQLQRFDDRAAIIILGHNLLQNVKGGSLAAMKAAMKILAMKAQADGKILMTALEPMAKVWAQANFGENPDDFPELHGELPEAKTWALVYDFTDPDDKQAAGVRAAQFGQAFSTFIKALIGKEGVATLAQDKALELLQKIDFEEAAERAGIPMLGGDEAYSEHDDADTELDGEAFIAPPTFMVGAAKRSLAWLQALRREGMDAGRKMARKIVRAQLTPRDIAQIAAYFPRHEGDKKDPEWKNLKRPSAGRIAWGLMGDSGDGRGRKWAEAQTANFRRGLGSAELAAMDAEFLALDSGATPLALPPADRVDLDDGSEVQSLIFGKKQFPTADSAKRWAAHHGYKHGDVDETGQSFRLRQREPGRYARLRTKRFKPGVKAVIGFLSAELLADTAKTPARGLIGIASVAVFDSLGRLLFGKRGDNGKWTMPGGHLEPGESPAEGAARELWEEADLTAPLTYLGSGTKGDYHVFCYRAEGVTADPSCVNDPDEEVCEWRWVDVSTGELPTEIAANLHAPRNVTLALLRLGSSEGIEILDDAAETRLADRFARMKERKGLTLTTLASGDNPDTAAGLIEGQRQVDALADEHSPAPGLAAVLAALAAAVDWGDLRERLTGIVREHDLRDAQSTLRERLRAAEHIGTLSVDHDLPASVRAEVDAMDRRRSQAEKVADRRQGQERASTLATAATAYALYSVARHLWDSAKTAEATGHPLEVHRQPLGEALSAAWGKDGALWDNARAQPLQTAFTRARAKRLTSDPLAAIYPYWRYDAVLDGRTTQQCRSLNGLVRPAGSPDFPIPPLHWRCRSTVRGISRADGEGQVSAPMATNHDPGFATANGYPAPEDGPEELMKAYRERV